MIDPRTFAESTLLLLQQDPRRYKNFGVFWYLVKAVLKKYYTRDNLHLLGDHVDASVVERMPEFANLQEALKAATEEYRQNATFNLGSNWVEDPAGGGTFQLIDPDADGL